MSLSRRQFCVLTSAAGLATAGNRFVLGDQPQNTLRVIAYNVFGGTGWPKDRRLAKSVAANGQMPTRLAMQLSLYQPDIINFSESPSEDFVKQVASLLEMNYVRFPSGGRWPGTLLSRFEIVDSKNVPLSGDRPKDLFTRHWGQATVKLPTGESIVVHSAHLMPTSDPTIRLREIRAMLQSMQADLAQRRSMILMGDLNHGPKTREYRLWTSSGWTDTFAKLNPGKNGFTIRSDIPRGRIDYIMANGPIANRIIQSRPLFEGAFRLHIADKESFALSDHIPQLAVFQMTP